MLLHRRGTFGCDRRIEKTELAEDREIGKAGFSGAEKEGAVTQQPYQVGEVSVQFTQQDV